MMNDVMLAHRQRQQPCTSCRSCCGGLHMNCFVLCSEALQIDVLSASAQCFAGAVMRYLQQDGVRGPGGKGGADGGGHELRLELAALRGCQADQQAVGAGPHEWDVQVGGVHILPRRQVLVPA
jgi:hypothetical protein